jgi:hypothetical protein
MDTDQPTVAWGAVAAGALAIAVLTLVLVALGSAVGFSSVSPWPNSGISAKTFQISTGLYFVFTALVASTIGGYISGRLRSKWTGIHTYEVQFRDTAHGFLAWAFAAIVGTAALGSAATYLTGSNAVTTAPNAAADYYVAQLMRLGSVQPATAPSDSIGNTTMAAPQRTAPSAVSSQARSILIHGAAQEASLSDADRAYLAQLVSAQTGASQADAEKRVSDVLTQAKAEADQARKAAASISIWLTISMLVGAFAAALAAIEGGQLRDRRWRGVLWTRASTEAKTEP